MKKSQISKTTQSEFRLIGISAAVRDYRLCWLLNDLLSVDLKRIENIQLDNPKKQTHVEFAHFVFENEIMQQSMRVIANRAEKEFFIAEMPKADFLLLLNGEWGANEIKLIFSKLKSCAEIDISFEINQSLIRNKSQLELI